MHCCCCFFQSVFNGMHVIFVPYSLMKVDPASWMKMVTRYKGTKFHEINHHKKKHVPGA